MEILPGIHSIPVGASAFMGVSPPNVYLALGGDGAAFIDSGYSRPEDVKARMNYLATVGSPQVLAVIVTHRHPDHMGGAAAFHQATGAPLICSPIEKPIIDATLEKSKERTQVHQTVAHGEALDLGGLTLEYVHSPGHTLGSMAVYAREHRALFTGDTILGFGTTVVSPEDGDMGQYLQTLRLFLEYDLALICPGHGPVVRDPRAKINELIQHRLEREGQIVSALQESPKSLEQLFQGIYPELDSRLHAQAHSQVRSHLIKLEREGRVRVQEETYSLAG